MSVLESPGPAASTRPAPTRGASRAAAPDGSTASARPFGERLSDFRELTKPRIAAMALITVTAGYLMAGSSTEILPRLPHALLGIAMVAGACGTLNQYVERRSDAKMPRTARRPLPAGRIPAGEALLFGAGLGVFGIAYLAVFVNGPTAVLSAATLFLYVLAYTPMKRLSSWCTVVGAVPGAMPPVLGWAAAGGGPPLVPLALFGVLYIWQFPHLLAIAWLYQRQYAAAGLHMLPGQYPRRGLTGAMACASAAALIPISLLPCWGGLVGAAYATVAILLGGGYLTASVIFWRNENQRSARWLLWASLLYLPIVLAALAIEFALVS